MSTASVEELQRNLQAYLNQVENGEEILISNGNKLIAKLSPLTEDEDRHRLALQGLARAYGDNEPEYTADLIKEPNPEYRHERRRGGCNSTVARSAGSLAR